MFKSNRDTISVNDCQILAHYKYEAEQYILTLSSKEIALLLNISPRSVEVKRYRLRKKMDLPHEFNLTNYIFEI